MTLTTGQILGGHYQILNHLGGGGFGQTYLAEDQYLPGKPRCVVKQLKPQATDPLTLQTARRLFDSEAKVLHQLGSHDQIPRLFAYFEENQEFYLVQEFIEGHTFSQELPTVSRGGGTPAFNENQVVALLQEILEVLAFVHQQNVIHRDIKPDNLIRRHKDSKLVLIDFGAVKQISTQLINGGQACYTVAIGTPGYLPSEQANGSPKLSSDIYAVGMLGIQALTGVLPNELSRDPDSDEIIWQQQVTVSPKFAKFLDKMVRYDFRERYQSADEALQALKNLKHLTAATLALPAGSSSNSPVSQKPKGKSRLIPWKTGLFLVLAAIGISAAISIVNAINFSSATDLYQQGKTLLDLKRYEEALTAYQKALKIRPDYWQAWTGRGKALANLKQYSEALNAYDKAIQLKPDSLEAWVGRGEALDNLQRSEEALDSFDKALKIQPQSSEAWKGQGDALSSLQRYEEAVTAFDKAIEFQPDYYSAWYSKAWAFHNLKKYEEAITAFNKALELKSDAHLAWYHRGNSLISLNRYQEAIGSYEKAVNFQPDFYQAWYSRGNALSNLQQYPEAIASYKKVLRYKPNFYEASYNIGWSFHQLQRYEEAIDAYDQAIKLKRNDAQVWYNKGNAFYNLKQYQKAIRSYERTVQLKPDNHEAWYSQGNAFVNLKQYPEALAAYNKAIQYKQDYQQAIEARNRVQSQLESEKSSPNPKKD